MYHHLVAKSRPFLKLLGARSIDDDYINLSKILLLLFKNLKGIFQHITLTAHRLYSTYSEPSIAVLHKYSLTTSLHSCKCMWFCRLRNWSTERLTTGVTLLVSNRASYQHYSMPSWQSIVRMKISPTIQSSSGNAPGRSVFPKGTRTRSSTEQDCISLAQHGLGAGSDAAAPRLSLHTVTASQGLSFDTYKMSLSQW